MRWGIPSKKVSKLAGPSRLVDRVAAVVREQEVHGAYDLEAIVAVSVAVQIPERRRNGAGAVHGMLPMLFEHQFREVPRMLVVIHGPLRPEPLPIAQLGSFHQTPVRPDVTGRTGMADFRAIRD